MTNHLTLDAARGMTSEQLVETMRAGFEMSEDGVRKACIAIAVLEERDVALPMLPEVYRHAREIAEGKLSAHAGLILGRFPFAISGVLGLPLALQDEIADGRKVKVAVKINGRISTQEMSIFEMSQMQMRLAFGEDGITPWEQQGEWLLKSGFEEPSTSRASKPRVAVDSESGEIVINRSRLTVDDLIPALSALGYSVKPVYGGKGIKPVKVI